MVGLCKCTSHLNCRNVHPNQKYLLRKLRIGSDLPYIIQFHLMDLAELLFLYISINLGPNDLRDTSTKAKKKQTNVIKEIHVTSCHTLLKFHVIRESLLVLKRVNIKNSEKNC